MRGRSPLSRQPLPPALLAHHLLVSLRRSCTSVLQFHGTRLSESIERHDEHIVVLSFRNRRVGPTPELRNDCGHSVVVSGHENHSSCVIGLDLPNKFWRVARIYSVYWKRQSLSERLHCLLSAAILSCINCRDTRAAENMNQLLR